MQRGAVKSDASGTVFQVEVDAADCAILRATPTFICSGDTSGNV